mmetsp:Transcript_9544/g.13339  ORF Transcript_9544/g.13339 Transcript_9544/m.13339 type:complete len:607 (-) Transcript_9544:189-2009(-)
MAAMHGGRRLSQPLPSSPGQKPARMRPEGPKKLGIHRTQSDYFGANPLKDNDKYVACSKCTFENLSILNFCEACDADLRAAKRKSNQKQRKRDSALVASLSTREERNVAKAIKLSLKVLDSEERGALREGKEDAKVFPAAMFPPCDVSFDLSNVDATYRGSYKGKCPVCKKSEAKSRDMFVPTCLHMICITCLESRARACLRQKLPLRCYRSSCKKRYTKQAISELCRGSHKHQEIVAKLTIACDLPRAPTIYKVQAGDKFAVVFFRAVKSGRRPIDSIIIKSDDNKVKIPDAQSPQIIPNLKNGREYTFVAYSVNSVGKSNPSNRSAPVVPCPTKDGTPVEEIFNTLCLLKDINPKVLVKLLKKTVASNMVSFRASRSQPHSKNLVKAITKTLRNVQDRSIHGGLIGAKKAAAVEVCFNPVHVRSFLRRRGKFKKAGIPYGAGFAFFSTPQQYIQSVFTTNLDPNRFHDVSDQGFYGRGVYFGTKHVRTDHDTFILALTLQGNRKTVEPKLGQSLSPGFQSHYGDSDAGRDELVIFHKDQILPLMVVHTHDSLYVLHNFDSAREERQAHRSPPPPPTAPGPKKKQGGPKSPNAHDGKNCAGCVVS